MAPRVKAKQRATKTNAKGKTTKVKSKVKSKKRAKAKIEKPAEPRPPRPIPRPKLFWTNEPKLVGPHPCNCNCTYCFHVRNCIVNEMYDSHFDGGPDCRRLGMRVDTGPSGMMVNQSGSCFIESIYSEWM